MKFDPNQLGTFPFLFSLCLCGCSLGILASSHSLNVWTYKLIGEKQRETASLNELSGLLSGCDVTLIQSTPTQNHLRIGSSVWPLWKQWVNQKRGSLTLIGQNATQVIVKLQSEAWERKCQTTLWCVLVLKTANISSYGYQNFKWNTEKVWNMELLMLSGSGCLNSYIQLCSLILKMYLFIKSS